MRAFGIDLGTTYSCIAYIDDSGRPVIVRNNDSDTIPSVVWFAGPEEVTVGQVAKDTAVISPDEVVSLVKREMGNQDWERTFHGKRHTPETVSALILRSLADVVRSTLGETVTDVVVTVPAYFGLAEREATRRAGEIAGLTVLDLVPEPVAAALHYNALRADAERTVLVYDLGGGTFDTTVIRLGGDRVEVVCTDGDHKLGGADWDAVVRTYLLDRFQQEHPSVDAQGDEVFLQDVATQAEQLKRDLTTAASRRRVLRFGSAAAAVELSRTHFEELTAHLLDQTVEITKRTLATARDRGVDRFDDVLLVGGSSKMPAVAARLKEAFGFEPKLHDPDLAVAKGAAIYSLIKSVSINLHGGEKRPEQIDAIATQLAVPREAVAAMAERSVTTVVPRAFGVRLVDTDQVGREFVDHVLKANDPLPANPPKRTYGTVVPNQREILIEVREQAGSRESPEIDDTKWIGEGLITGLPPLPAGAPVEVTFAMDAMGRLNVRGVEPSSGQAVDVTIDIGGMNDHERDQERTAIARFAVDR